MMAPDRNELTVRAMVVGCLIGALLAASNVYVGLKIGMLEAGAITAAIIGFVTLSMVGSAPSRRETNVLVTAAAAASTMAGASGLVGPLAAMAMLGTDVPALAVVAWSISTSVLGLLIALPLRTPLITSEGGLPFPSGRATAEVIESMAAVRTVSARRARALFASMGISAVITWFRDGRTPIIPATIPLPGRIGDHSLESLTVSIGVSPLLLSAGALIGPRVGISLLVGAVCAWVVLTPMLVDAGLVPSVAFRDVVSWLMWPGAALLVSSTLTSLALKTRMLARGVGQLSTMRGGAAQLTFAIVAISVITGALAWLAFDIDPVAIVLAMVLTPPLAAACARACGETDIAPVGPLGGFAQIAIAPFTPANPLATLGGGAMVSGAAAQTSQAMYAFRAGHLLGSSPRALIAAHLVGIGVGALVVVPVYTLLTSAYGLGTDLLPAAAPQSWKATAQAVSGGIADMPAGAPLAALIGGGAGFVLTLLERHRAGRFLPSAIGIGMAFLMPALYSIALFLGAILFTVLRRRWAAATDEHGTAIAAGGIAGEAVMGIVIALLMVLVFAR